jgi:hypothetical protein
VTTSARAALEPVSQVVAEKMEAASLEVFIAVS